MTNRVSTILFGNIHNIFGTCAKKCGRIAITSKQATCKQACVAKRDAAIRAARAKVNTSNADARGNPEGVEKSQQVAGFHGKHV